MRRLAACLGGWLPFVRAGQLFPKHIEVEKTRGLGAQKWVPKMKAKTVESQGSSTVRVDIAEFYSCSIVYINDVPHEGSLHESEGIRFTKGWTRSWQASAFGGCKLGEGRLR